MATTQTAKSDFVADGGYDALAADLVVLSSQIEDYDPDDLTGYGDDEPSIDCRLRYHDGSWSLLSGDASYDQDHRGHWGASSVGPNLSADDARDIVKDLVEQILDSVATTE